MTMMMKLCDADGGDDDDDGDGDDDEKDSCGGGDGSDDGNDGTSPSIIIPFTRRFFPGTQTTTHIHAHTRKQCLIKANVLIIDDGQGIGYELKKQSSWGPTDSFHVTRRIPPSPNDSPSLPLLTWEEHGGARINGFILLDSFELVG